MKYVDVEKLKSEIIRIYNEHPVHSTERYEDGIEDGYHGCCDEIVEVIDSLQQEQPDVDLEKEIQNYFQGYWPGMETAEQCNTDMHFTPPAIMRLVKYAYELGKNARKEE